LTAGLDLWARCELPYRATEHKGTEEVDLLRLIAAGLTNRQIGQRLRWSHATVKKYVQRVLEKLDVQDRTRAAAEGVRRGLVD